MHAHTCVHTFFLNSQREGGTELDEEDIHLHSNAAFMLTSPGKVLEISALNSQHTCTFRDRGEKQGAVEAIEHLEEAGLGIIHEERATRGNGNGYSVIKI